MINIIICTVPGNDDNLQECLSSIIRNTKDDYNIIIVKNNYIGFAKAYNQGLKMCKDNEADSIILNDDIIIINDKWLDNLKSKTKEYDIIGNDLHDGNHVPFYYTYIKKSIFNKIGYLDERFEIGEWEDVDFCIRAIDAGFKIGYSYGDVFHKVHGTLNKLSKEQNKKRLANKDIFLNKWKDTKWGKIWQ